MANTTLTPLSTWLNKHPENIIAFQDGETSDADDFLLRVSQWMGILGRYNGDRWAVYHADAFEFLAIIFALWQLDRTACIPGDNRPATIDRLTARVDGFIGDFPGKAVPTADQTDSRTQDVSWRELKQNFLAIEIYTSGSTGEPKPISKTMRQLEEELQSLETLWPSEPEAVIATVTHQHLYGLTFRLFWPFCTGRTFSRNLCEYPEDILRQASGWDRFSLISSPTHLRRLNDSLSWDKIADGCQYVLSAAAPLDRRDSLAVGELLQAPVREIYGSSETGAIAWRMQKNEAADALWQSLPGVQLSATVEGTLRVDFAYSDSVDPLILPDKVTFTSVDFFSLLGRVDRIVKIEGKRVSLAAIEHALLENSTLVEDVKALTIERQRVETAVVIQLTAEGNRVLADQGRKALIKGFKSELANEFEAVVLPRRWRFTDQIPYNPQGKISLESLQLMFEKEPVIWPKIIHQSVDGAQLLMECVAPAELAYFKGHFEEQPILPGIVQVHWAEAYGRQFLPLTGRFIRLEVIKFQKVIVPDQVLTITLKYDSEKMKLTFKYESDAGVHSSGRVCFE
ncbi:MAG: AMP-binding protein [Pseudomonadales bacterium]|nr:AMP-binding protein [Pseudomonadales bacterium]